MYKFLLQFRFIKTQADILINKSGTEKCTNLRVYSLTIVELNPQKKRHAEFYGTAVALLNQFWYDKPQHSREVKYLTHSKR